MTLYLTAARRWWTVPVAAGLLVLGCWAVGGTELPLPSFMGGMTATRVRYFTPLLVVTAVLYCLERRLTAAERTAVVPVSRLDRAALLSTVALVHLLSPVAGLDTARNVMLLLGVVLVLRRFANEAAAGGGCLALLVATAVLGHAPQPTGAPTAQWWALPLHPSASLPAWAASAALLTAALFTTKERSW
ncbi:hypothetical protein [Streptomyces sp. NPDC054838]